MTLNYLLNLSPFYFPAGSGGAGAGGGDGEDDMGELAQDLHDLGDDAPPEGKDDKEGEDDDEAGKGDDESEEEAEEEGEEESGEDDKDEEEEGEKGGKKASKEDAAELDEQGRPTVKALKAVYPDLFKKFPGLRQAFFEHPRYQEIFADPESAQLASEKASEYDQLESSLVEKGDPSMLVATLGENNPKALTKIVENFADAVRAHDKDLYSKLATPIIEELVYHAAAYANKIGAGKDQPGRNLLLAAKHMANFVFANGGEIPDISAKKGKKEEGESDAERELREERDSYRREKYQGAMNELEGNLMNTLHGVLDNKLDSLTPFERKAVIKDARREIDQTLLADRAFQRTLGALWRQAAEQGYSDDSKSRIRRAWLDRAKSIAPGIRNRLRQEALDSRTPGKRDAEGKEGKKRQFPGQGGKGPGSARGVADPKKIDWRKTTDLDIMNS